jgi:hypothetical protein
MTLAELTGMSSRERGNTEQREKKRQGRQVMNGLKVSKK